MTIESKNEIFDIKIAYIVTKCTVEPRASYIGRRGHIKKIYLQDIKDNQPMGIAGLWNILSRMSKGLNRADYFNRKTVSVDISGLLYSYYYTSSDEERKNYHVRATFLIITRILSLGLVPIFVFDSGAPHRLKAEELERRRRAEANTTRSAQIKSEPIDSDEYQRLEAEGLSDIVKHFSVLQEHNSPQYPSSKAAQESPTTEYWADSVKESTSSSTSRIIRCTTCHNITPIQFDQLDTHSTTAFSINTNNASKDEEDKGSYSSDLLEFGADYNYEGTKLLLSHKLHSNSDSIVSQLGEYANWQLNRRLMVSRINEQVFTAIRQQRDSARLALRAAISPHKQTKKIATGMEDTTMKHSVFDMLKDAEDYFSTLEVSNECSKQPSTPSNLPTASSFVTLASQSTGDGWHDSSSGLITLQEMDTTSNSNIWSYPTGNLSRMRRIMTFGAAVGTTFSSFVNQSDQFSEVNVFKGGVYSMHKRLADNYNSSSVYKPLTDRVITDVLQIARLFRVPCIKCRPGYEAEYVCALLNSHGYVAAVLTEDSDVVAYRPVLVLRLFGRLSSIHDVSGFQSIRQKDIHLYFSDDDIIFLALIMGCDFCDGIPSFGYVHTLELLLYLKYFVASDTMDNEFQNITIHRLIDRFRLYMSFNSLIIYPNCAESQIKGNVNFILDAHEVTIKQNWEKIVAYKAQPCFSTYFPKDYQSQTFLRDLAQLRFLLNRRLWLRRDLILRQLQRTKTTFAAQNNDDLLGSMFKELTSKWNAVIKVFSQQVPVEEACTPMFAGGRSIESLIQGVNAFNQQHIVEHLDTLIEGSDDYRQRTGEELQRLIGLPPLSIQTCLQRTRASFIKNREDINRVRVTELLSAPARRGSIFDFQSLGRRTFQSMRALFVLKTVYS